LLVVRTTALHQLLGMTFFPYTPLHLFQVSVLSWVEYVWDGCSGVRSVYTSGINMTCISVSACPDLFIAFGWLSVQLASGVVTDALEVIHIVSLLGVAAVI
jgi:hypothetical protein